MRTRIASILLSAVVGSGLAATSPQGGAPATTAGEPGLELRVAGSTAAVLNHVTKTVVRFALAAPRQQPAGAFRAERLALRPDVVAAAPAFAPTAIAIGPDGRLYIADAIGPAIHVVEADGRLSTFYRGPDLSYPIGLAVGDNGRLYVLDGVRRAILSLKGPNAVPVEEFALDRADAASEAQTLFWRANTVWAVNAGTGSVVRLFVSEKPSPSARSLRGGETVVFRDIVESRATRGAIGLGPDGLFALDRASRRLRALSLSDGATLGVDYAPFMANPVALATTDDAIFLLGKDAGSLVRLPMLSQVTAYFEAGQPSENAVQFYEYLVDRHLMPFRKYTLRSGDEIRNLVTAANLLPAGPTESFEALFCRFNQRFCVNDNYPRTYFPGQEITLPDIAPTRYVGRTALRLPVDAGKYPVLAAQKASRTVGDVSRALAPLTAQQEDTLQAVVKDLNYTVRASDIMKQTEGNFILPVDAVRLGALVPQRDLSDPRSPLSLLTSKNMKLVPTTPASASELSLPVEAAQAVAQPPSVVPEPDGRCAPYDPGPYTMVQKLISFCIPTVSSTVSMVIIDRRFDYSHDEFKDGAGHSRLKPIGTETESVDRKPISDDEFDNFDVKIDHGTHVAGLLAARNATHQVVGLVPTVQLYAATAAKAKELFDTTRLNICNISLGDSGKAAVGVPTDVSLLYELIGNPAYANVLFVVSAGNDGRVPPKNTLASLASRSNVIVVGASSWDRLPTMSPYSNHDAHFVHIVAPGNMIKSTTFGGGYGVATGTSQATALVSGTAALLRATTGAAWAPWQIKERLLSTADLWLYKNGESDKVFSGMLNMKRALFDTGYAILTKHADGSVIKGTIAPDDAERKISIDPLDKDGPGAPAIRFGDIRRFKRNGDGTYTILYSVQSDRKDPLTRTLERLLDVQAEQIAPLKPTEPLSFQVFQADGTAVVVQLLDLEDFINAVI